MFYVIPMEIFGSRVGFWAKISGSKMSFDPQNLLDLKFVGPKFVGPKTYLVPKTF